MKCFFDTSALVAHALHQPGAEQVQELIDDPQNELAFSALSLFELAGVLKNEGGADLISRYWQVYQDIAEPIPVDNQLALSAWELRENIGLRIPLADAIIAATARARGDTLVHRDRHLAAIPDSLVPQIRLPSA